ncbi:TolC family protein [Acinetobacter sp. HY1485]|uniref:TolC family protein n=1 Tax=Acinetobacter sp. HY1485 TaxID=2970918 RepID=UPI0022B9BB2E|nr:TolC family protein [Acinetobacter sp. HY1485]
MKIQSLMLAVTLSSSMTHAFNLQEAWKAAENNASELEKNRYDLIANQEQIPIARATLLPQVVSSASYQKQRQTQPSLLDRTSQSWRISASQTIFNLNKWYKYKESQIAGLAAQQQFDLSRQQLLLKVSEAYFNVLIAQESLASSQKAKDAFLIQKQQAEAQFKKGVVSIVDVQEAQSGYESALADEIEITAQLVQANVQLEIYTHLDSASVEQLPVEGIQLPNLSIEEWHHQVQENNLELNLQNQAIARAEQELKATQANHYPTVEVSTGYNKNPNSYSSDSVQNYDTQAGYIGINVNLPLFSGGETNALIRQARAKLASEQAELKVLKEKVKLSTAENFAKVETGKARIKALAKLVETNQVKVRSSTLGQQYGLLSNVDRIRAEKELYESKLKLTQAKYQFLQAEINLMQLCNQMIKAQEV